MEQYRQCLKSRHGLFLACVFFPVVLLHGMDDLFNGRYDKNVDSIEALADKVTYEPVKKWLDWGIIKLRVNRPSAWAQYAQRAGIGEERLDRLRWYNTLLTKDDSLFGLYKGDFVDSARTVGDLTVDSLIRKMLMSKRTNAILESMLSDSTELIFILDHIEESRVAFDQNWMTTLMKTGIFPSMRCRAAQANPLINYLQEKHRYFGKLPFTAETILPLFARWLYYKLSESVAKKYAPSLQDRFAYGTLSAYSTASYVTNEEGKPTFSNAIPGFPLAPVRWLTSGLRWWYDPFKPTAMRAALRHSIDKGKMGIATTVAGSILLPKKAESIAASIPSILSSDTAFEVYDFLGLCFGAKVFDEIYMQRWTQYVMKHRAQLRSLLKKYELAANNVDEKNDAREALQKFIEKGHRDKGKFPGSMVGTWWQAIRSGHTVVPSWVNFAVAGSLIARGLLFYRALIKKTT